MKDTHIYRWQKTSEDNLPEFGRWVNLIYDHGDTKSVAAEMWSKESQRFWKMNSITDWCYISMPLEEINTRERETAEQVLRKYFKTKDNSDIHWMPEVIQAMEDYRNQFSTSVPVSKDSVCSVLKNRIDHFYSLKYHGQPAKQLQAAMKSIIELVPPENFNELSKSISEEEKNVYREQGWDAADLFNSFNNSTSTQYGPEPNIIPMDKDEFLSSFLPKKP